MRGYIASVYSSHVLCDISGDKQIEINSRGYLVLTGPHHGIEIKDYFSMRPFYDSNCDITTSKMLWESTIGVSDIFMGDWLETWLHNSEICSVPGRFGGSLGSHFF
jgi:hypothetical protein